MTRPLKAAGILLVILPVLFTACSKKKSPEPELPKYEWTILGYFDGNNPEDQATDGHSYVIEDLKELEDIGSTDSVHILVMLGSSQTDGDCKYYHVEKDTGEADEDIVSPVLQNLGKKDMSDYVTLRDFIGYGMQNYSAKHYMLIVNDHGKGWRGLCSDNVNGGGSWMTLPELSSALSGFEFDIIWFYSPSMATVEVAYQIKDRADYMIASQFKNYPDNIMGSSYWLSLLMADPMMSVRLFAIEVVQGIQSAAQEISATKKFDATLINLARIPQLAENISNFSRDAIDSAGAYWGEIWDSWEPSQTNKFADSEYVDLRELAQQIQDQSNLNSVIKDDAAAIETAFEGNNRAVLLQLQYPSHGSSGGLSISLPWNHEDFDSVDYASLDLATTNWPEFVSVFTQTYLGNYAGALTVTSNITGARIFLDGVDTGHETPATIGGLYPRLCYLHLDKPGYCHHSTDPLVVTIFPRQTVSRYVTLDPCR